MGQDAEHRPVAASPELSKSWPGLSFAAQPSLTDVTRALGLHSVTDISIFSAAELQPYVWGEGAAAHCAGGSSS